MKKTTCGFLAAVAALVVAGSASAQRIPLSVEGRVDAAIPTGDLGDAADVGIGLHGDVTFNVTPILGVYGGYSWSRFGAKDTNGLDFTDQGFDVGVKATFAPMQGLGAAPFFRGGAIIHKLKVSASDDSGNFSASSDSKVGFEVGAGVAFPIAPRIMLTPQVGYSQFNAADSGDEDATVSVVHAGAGISIAF